MLTDLYSDLDKEIYIGPDQVEEYKMVLDVDQDSSVTFEDIVNVIKKYLVDDNAKMEKEHDETEEVIQSTIVTTLPIARKAEQTQSPLRAVQLVTQQKQVKEVEKVPQQLISKQAPQQEPERKYNQRTLYKLDLAKRLFNQFQQNGYITKYEVPSFLRETYKSIGIAGEVTRDDVDQWMVMADRDNDGRVYYGDFEIMLIESLKESGLEIFI